MITMGMRERQRWGGGRGGGGGGGREGAKSDYRINSFLHINIRLRLLSLSGGHQFNAPPPFSLRRCFDASVMVPLITLLTPLPLDTYFNYFKLCQSITPHCCFSIGNQI